MENLIEGIKAIVKKVTGKELTKEEVVLDEETHKFTTLMFGHVPFSEFGKILDEIFQLFPTVNGLPNSDGFRIRKKTETNLFMLGTHQFFVINLNMLDHGFHISVAEHDFPAK